MDLGLEGKGAIVTGGSRGIGTSVALTLAREGCNVAINYRKSDTEAKELTVMPLVTPSWAAVTMVTPVVQRRMATRRSSDSTGMHFLWLWTAIRYVNRRGRHRQASVEWQA